MLDDEFESRLEEIGKRIFGEGEPPEWVEERIRQAMAAGEGFEAARRRVYLQLAQESGAASGPAWSGNLESIAKLLRGYAPTLADEAITNMAREFDPVAFGEGEDIIRQDEPGDAMYLIETGQVEVTRSSPFGRGSLVPPTHVADLGPGAVVGEMSLIYNEPRNANVVARGDVRAYRLHKDAWIHIQAQYPVFAARMEEVAAERAKALP